MLAVEFHLIIRIYCLRTLLILLFLSPLDIFTVSPFVFYKLVLQTL